MARLEAPVVVSANCLLAGHVLYLGKNHQWVETLALAHRFDSLDAANAAAGKANDPAQVIGLSLIHI